MTIINLMTERERVIHTLFSNNCIQPLIQQNGVITCYEYELTLLTVYTRKPRFNRKTLYIYNFTNFTVDDCKSLHIKLNT